LFETLPVDNPISSPRSVNFPPLGKILKRIPRGARDIAAEEFQRSLRVVLDEPESREGWTRLMGFAGGCLGQPSVRGGKRHNLTSSVVAHIKTFSEAKGVLDLFPHPKAKESHSQRATKVTTHDEAVARRAAAKMDEGDVKGAIR